MESSWQCSSTNASRHKLSLHSRAALDQLTDKFEKLSLESASDIGDKGKLALPMVQQNTKSVDQKSLIHKRFSAPAVSRIPLELVQMIYTYLDPKDFNAARHSSRAWMLASQNSQLLKQMLQRGGWWNGVVEEIGHDSRNVYNISPWFLSRRLARECSLSANWTGNGLHDCASRLGYATSQISFTRTHLTDLTELSSVDSGPAHQNDCGLLLTPSICGSFLLVADGCSIYMYNLNGASMHPVTLIICPKRVLSMNMDTSSHHHCVAALLDGRMGALCEFEVESKQADYGERYQFDDSQNLCMSVLNHPFVGRIGVQSFRISTPLQEQYLDSMHESSRQFTREGWRMTTGASFDHTMQAPKAPSAISLSRSPLTVYHSICSPEDPPRTVAVCPNRQCLAFGCDTGVELHWKDCLSGKHLMKWFSLTTQTDFLYFFPKAARSGDDSRLRLISSQAGPGQSRKDPSFHLKHALGMGEMQCVQSVDHYGAVPLSDGHHVLFTDPSSGNLIIGTDKHRSLDGLDHRVTLIPPPHVHVSKLCPPSVYACAKDLCWGARVVAVYGDELVFFSIPPDLLTYWRCQADLPKGSPRDVPFFDNDFSSWLEWVNTQSKGICLVDDALQAQGASLGKVRGVVSLAVHSATDPVVWAFCINGTAHTWQIGSGSRPAQIKERMINCDGAIVDLTDCDGDRIMLDAPAWRDSEDGDMPQFDVDEDGDGDALMADAPTASDDCALGAWGIEYIPSLAYLR